MSESNSPVPTALQRRLFQPGDVDEALQLLPDWLLLDAAQRAALPALWLRLLPHPGFNADVIEDRGAPAGRRIQGLGMAIALDEPWAQRLRGPVPAGVTQRLYADLLSGRTQPLGERALARANSSQGAGDGVTFFVLHYQQRERDMTEPAAVAVLSAGLTAMRVAHAGHRVREIFQEAWLAEQDYMHSIGMQRRSQHAPELPALFSLRRDEALARLPGFQLREIFEHRPPLLHFRGAEQRLLRRALFNESDDEIAAVLGVSPHTLKKLWRSIYARVEERFPALLGASAVSGAAEGVRGPEKRRALLAHLRQHPQELRPHTA